MRRISAWSIVPIVAAAVIGVAPPASADPAAVADPYVFTSADVGFSDGSDTEGRPERIAAMDDYLGEKKPIVRLDLQWDQVQPTRDGALNWQKLDQNIDAAYARGVRVLLILDYAPSWANGGREPNWLPADDETWKTIVRQTVAHFGPKVQAYEIWNEPNFARFASYGDNSTTARMQRYWELVEDAYTEIDSACPDCVVLAGGSGGGDVYEKDGVIQNDNEASDWLDYGYRSGKARFMDAVAYHPYPDWTGGHIPSYAQDPCHGTVNWYRYWSGFGPDDPVCGGLAAVRDVMVRNGDAGKKIWGTEFGFPSQGSRQPQTLERVRDALEEGVRMWRSRPYTGPLFLYSFQDTAASHELCVKNPADGECHFGLRDSAGRPKEPMYSDLREVLNGDNWLPALAPGRSLFRGAALRSANGQYTLWMQADGNLVLYDVRGATPKAVWVQGGQKAYRLSVQHDGNLVLYDYADRPLWATGSQGRGDSTLRLGDDGALVLQPANQTEPSWNSGDLFASGVEEFQAGNTWTNTVSGTAPGGGLRNVGGITGSLTGPELFSGTNAAARSGGRALTYSGKDNSASSSYAYTKVFGFGELTVTPTTRLSYWIYPQSGATSWGLATGTNSSCVAADLILVDPATGARTNLRDSGAKDQRGNRAHPAYQCGKLTLDAWNFVSVPLGGVAAGKRITQLDLGYDQAAATGGYRGYVDDLRITR
ncbi:hypothetical protein Acy02nite_76740 [Actinoplanes cyaneus]|uniref:Bulb-type lectin domain-containing protein n=1 Tax=Actinoplanes cyaneus TaxID=52696 RepID=A0A919IUC6_9ACTN|nr:cellulase family glycosylhydrolase [Actinoplanes cyaneus]MCW2143948.1 Cellulase (glycosyl hydrolase family 5) [Actinoplanes cyaneus]GID69793.1 hypothetical protein Acy02nite_76740 [Actinoplanes cyaneus]